MRRRRYRLPCRASVRSRRSALKSMAWPLNMKRASPLKAADGGGMGTTSLASRAENVTASSLPVALSLPQPASANDVRSAAQAIAVVFVLMLASRRGPSCTLAQALVEDAQRGVHVLFVHQ